MTDPRPLRAVFDELAGRPDAPAAGPADLLAGSGYGDLPGPLVAEAIVSYAGTAPVEVAEHLAPFVTAHSGVPLAAGGPVPDPAVGLDLLATAPVAPVEPDGGEPVPDQPAPEPDPAGEAGPEFGAGDLTGGADLARPEPAADAGPQPAAESGAEAPPLEDPFAPDPLAGTGPAGGADPFGLDFGTGEPDQPDGPDAGLAG